jgi:hypothetical protein
VGRHPARGAPQAGLTTAGPAPDRTDAPALAAKTIRRPSAPPRTVIGCD